MTLAVCLCMGCWNAGFTLGSNNNVGYIMAAQCNWETDSKKNTWMSSMAVLGLMIGSIFSKPVLQIGLRFTILCCNACIVAITIPNFFVSIDTFYWLTTSRFLMGVFSAVIINATAAYIGETVPKEHQVSVGTVINTGIVLGLFVTAAFDLCLPAKVTEEEIIKGWKTQEDYEKLMDDELWRVSYSLQLLNVIATTVMWLVLYKHEPLKFLISNAEKSGKKSWHYAAALKTIKANYNNPDEDNV